MLRRSLMLSRSKWEKGVQRLRQDFALKHRQEYAIPATQATPTFADVQAPSGVWQNIDTSFVDIPDIDEPMPLTSLGAAAAQELDALQDEIKSAIKQQRRERLQAQADDAATPRLEGGGGADSSSSGGGGGTTNSSSSSALAASSKSSKLLALADAKSMEKKQQSPPPQPRRSVAEATLGALNRRIELASSLRTACERLTLMDQDGFQTFSTPVERNSGPGYEVLDMKIKRRRAWFSLRNTFLNAAPSLFATISLSHHPPPPPSVHKRDIGANKNGSENEENKEEEEEEEKEEEEKKNRLAVVAAGLRSANECCSLLVWMHTAADFAVNSQWAEPVTWDRRPQREFESIDFGRFALLLLRQFSDVLKVSSSLPRVGEAAASSSISSLDNFVALCTLCRRCGVGSESLKSTVLSADALLKVIAASPKPITALTAVSLGLCCHDDAALDLNHSVNNNSNNNNSNNNNNINNNKTDANLATVLLRAVARDPDMTAFGSLELTFLLELMMRMKKATTTAATNNSTDSSNTDDGDKNNSNNASLFDLVLSTAQGRMRILMQANLNPTAIRGTTAASSIAEVFDAESNAPVNPLQRMAEHMKRNAAGGAAPLVFDQLRLYQQQVPGLKAGSAKPEDVVRFFKLLSEISSLTSRNRSCINKRQNGSNEQRMLFNKTEEEKEADEQESRVRYNHKQTSAIWARDVVARTMHLRVAGSSNSIDADGAVSLLEALVLAAPLMQPLEVDRCFGTVDKTLCDLALSLHTVRDVVRILRSVKELMSIMMTQRTADGGPVIPLALTSLPSLEMRLLRTASNSNSRNRMVHEDVLSLEFCAEMSDCFVAMSNYPKLALLSFGTVALKALKDTERFNSSNSNQTTITAASKNIEDCLRVASCLMKAEEESASSSSSSSSDSSSTSDLLLARLIGSICSHIAPPSATLTRRELARLLALKKRGKKMVVVTKKNKNNSSSSSSSSATPATAASSKEKKILPAHQQFLAPLMQLLASPVVTAQRVSVFVPLQRTCLAIISSSSSSSPTGADDSFHAVASSSLHHLLELTRAAFKISAANASNNDNTSSINAALELRHQLVASILSEAAKSCFFQQQQQQQQTQEGTIFSFLELTEIINFASCTAVTESQDAKNHEQAVAAFLAESLDQLCAAVSEHYARVVFATRGGENSQGGDGDDEGALIMQSAEELVRLDSRSIAGACVKLLRSYQQNQQSVQTGGTATTTENKAEGDGQQQQQQQQQHVRQLMESCVRFLVCSFAVERAKVSSEILSALSSSARHASSSSLSSSSPAASSSSALGFERAHVARQRAKREQEQELKAYSELLRYGLRLAGSSCIQAAEKEWQNFA